MVKKAIFSCLAVFLAGAVLLGCASRSATGDAGVTGTGGSPTTGGTTGTGGAAPTGTGTGSARTPRTSDTPQPVTAENEGSVDDLAVTNAVRNKLNEEGITPAMDIQVQVEDGEVTLTGKVTDQATADRIVQMVRTVENVKDVDSRLEITP